MRTHDGNARNGGGARLPRRALVRLVGAAPLLAVATGAGPQGHGPPRAMARSRRPMLAWDPALGVHVVVSLPGVYYVDPYYYRFAEGVWLLSDDLDRWRLAPDHALPPALAETRAHEPGTGRRK